jgi:hypothetical protein
MVAEPVDVQAPAAEYVGVELQAPAADVEELPIANAALGAHFVLEPVLAAHNVLDEVVVVEEVHEIQEAVHAVDPLLVQEEAVEEIQDGLADVHAPDLAVMDGVMEEQQLVDGNLHGLAVEDSLALVPFVPKRSWESAFMVNTHLTAFDGSRSVDVEQRKPWVHASLKNIRIIDNVGGSKMYPVFAVSSDKQGSPPMVAPSPVVSGPFALGVSADKKQRGKQKKQKSVVQEGPRRFTRSQLVLDGHRAPVTPGLQPRPRKRSKKSAVAQGSSVAHDIPTGIPEQHVPPPVPISTLQKIGSLLEIDDNLISAEKLMASGEADASTKFPNDS